MKTTPALIGIVLAVITLSACQSEEAKVAQQKHEQDMKNLSSRTRSADTWVTPDLRDGKASKKTSESSAN